MAGEGEGRTVTRTFEAARVRVTQTGEALTAAALHEQSEPPRDDRGDAPDVGP